MSDRYASQTIFEASSRSAARMEISLDELEQRVCEESVAEYRNDILQHLAGLAAQNGIDPAMIEQQPELEWYMRPFLIDFLIELHGYFRLQPETLFLACSIADRYISTRIVYKRHYQLVVTTSLWIAAKYEDKKSRVPTAKELVTLCRNVYDAQMFIQMEKHILSTLKWNIGSIVTTHDCLKLLLAGDFLDTEQSQSSTKVLSSFLAELSLYEKNFMYFSSPVKAIASLLVASRILKDTHWPCIIAERIRAGRQFSLNDMHLDGLDIQALLEQTEAPFCHNSPGNELPLLNLDEQTLEEIRKCCLLYLNDIFKSKTLGKNLPEALMSKYKGHMFDEVFHLFTKENMDLYVNLCRLTQLVNSVADQTVHDRISKLTDLLIGTSFDGNSDVVSEQDSSDSALGSMYQSDWLTFSGGGGGTFNGNKSSSVSPASVMNPNTLLSQTSSQFSETNSYSPRTPGSIFSSSLSMVSVSTNSSPMIGYHKQPPTRLNSFSSTHQSLSQPRIVTRFNSIESDYME